jgi:two-component system sensor histidine kinase DesK
MSGLTQRFEGWSEGRPRGPVSAAAALVWLAFIVFPLVNAVTDRAPLGRHLVAIAGATLFVAAYVWLVLSGFGRGRTERGRLACAVLIAVAVGLTIGDRPGWGFLFTYCAACLALMTPPAYSFQAVATLAVSAAIATLLGHGDAGSAIGFGASTIGIGLLMVLLGDLRVRNQQLTEARAELARSAVAHERERFARDLHDLLGHSLSVIALKAELAGKLVDGQPQEAEREVREVERVARQALGEVRLAVSNYRQPTLDGELAGARLVLTAAGVQAEVERPAVKLDPEVEAVLAWTVREGATNVIRHSQAEHCTVRVGTALGQASVEVIDDGHGPEGRCDGDGAGGAGETPGNGLAELAEAPGNGLAGLAERARALAGRLEAGPGPQGGFRLRVTLPMPLQPPPVATEG